MDWIKQGKYIKWLIGFLVVVNLLTISIIWILIIDRKAPPPFDSIKKPAGALELMKKEIGLSDDQAKQFEKMRNESFEKAKLLFDRVNANKKLLSEELANDKTDTVLINSLTNQIGQMIAETEKERIIHFKKLISMCTPEQKEKFLPMLKQILGGEPPRDKPWNRPMFRDGKNDGMNPPPPNGGSGPLDRPGK